jgi:hypothetical protein
VLREHSRALAQAAVSSIDALVKWYASRRRTVPPQSAGAGPVRIRSCAAAAPAGAATVADCQAQIDQLAAQTAASTVTGKNAAKDKSGLLDKLTNANTKLSEGKNEDAVLKLQDFQARVRVLAETGKLAPADAQRAGSHRQAPRPRARSCAQRSRILGSSEMKRLGRKQSACAALQRRAMPGRI